MKFDAKAYALKHPALAARVPGLNARVKVSLPGTRPGELAELALYASLSALGIAHEQQYRWHPVRRWESDAAVPGAKLLVEVDGQAHIAGYERFKADMERRRFATFDGWAILAFTPAEALDGTAALEVQRWLSRQAQ